MKNLKTMTKFSWLLIVAMMFYGCGEDDVIIGSPPIVDAGADIDAFVGSTVTLNGTNSSDPDGGSLTYLWELAQLPAGSDATISGSTAANASFIPDEEGVYTARLTVTDEDNNSASDNVLINVSQDGVAGAETIIIDGNINSDTVWENIFNDPARPDYRVTANVAINAELTIMPGVYVEIVEDRFITVTSNGLLKAVGTSNNKIKLTSANIAGNIKWGGLIIESSNIQNELNHVEISYGGNSRLFFVNSANQFGNIGITSSGKLQIRNSLISNSAGQGIYVTSNGLEAFENNTFENNVDYAISIPFNQVGKIDGNSNIQNNGSENYVRIFGSTMTTNQEMVELLNDQSYLVTGNIALEGELDIFEGVKMEFDQDVLFQVASTGLLRANGTSSNKVVLTSSNIAGGLYWRGIELISANNQNELNHVEVSYGGESRVFFEGSANRFANLGIRPTGKISINNCLFSNGKGEGVHARPTSLLEFSNNSFVDNNDYAISIELNEIGKIDENSTFSGNGVDGVTVYSSTLNSDQTIANLSGEAFYLFTGDATVSANAEISAGADLQFEKDGLMTITSTGSLKSVGTAGNPIRITSSNRAGNIKWAGILIKSQSTFNEFRFTEISYGGSNDRRLEFFNSGNRHANIGISEGRLQIFDCTISNSDNQGIIVRSGNQVNGVDNSNANASNVVAGENSFSTNGAANVQFL